MGILISRWLLTRAMAVALAATVSQPDAVPRRPSRLEFGRRAGSWEERKPEVPGTRRCHWQEIRIVRAPAEAQRDDVGALHAQPRIRLLDTDDKGELRILISISISALQ
jgi:hypothetical protein